MAWRFLLQFLPTLLCSKDPRKGSRFRTPRQTGRYLKTACTRRPVWNPTIEMRSGTVPLYRIDHHPLAWPRLYGGNPFATGDSRTMRCRLHFNFACLLLSFATCIQ